MEEKKEEKVFYSAEEVFKYYGIDLEKEKKEQRVIVIIPRTGGSIFS